MSIAREVVAAQDLSLLRLAKMAIIYPLPSDPVEVVASTRVTPGMEVRAQMIAAAGLRISREPNEEDRDRRRGALVERIVWEQVRRRDRRTLRERSVQLTKNRWTGRSWSKPKEILAVRADECEVYECKLTPGSFDQDDLDDMADIRDTAADEGLSVYSTLATLESYTVFRQTIGRCRTRGDLHYVTEAEVFALRRATPNKTIRM